MKNKKYIFQATKPFQQYFKEGARVIWMLSHADKHDFIKSVIKQFDTGAYITMIPVYKTLQIDEAKITPKVREAL